MRKMALVSLSFGVVATPALAAGTPHVSRITPLSIFAYSPLPAKLLMLVLVGVTIAAIVICVRKVSDRQGLTGGSAFIAGLRVGGPFIGALGLAYGLLDMFIGVAMTGSVNLASMAPGIAVALMSLMLGMLAGSVAVLAHSLVNARIERDLLKS